MLARIAIPPVPVTVTIASTQAMPARFALVNRSSRRTLQTVAKSVPGRARGSFGSSAR